MPTRRQLPCSASVHSRVGIGERCGHFMRFDSCVGAYMLHQRVTRLPISGIRQALFGSLACAFVVSTGLSAATFDHSAWDRILKTYVNDLGEVDYAALKRDRRELDNYIQMLGESSPVNRPELFQSKPQELAYWMNAYNAFVVRGVSTSTQLAASVIWGPSMVSFVGRTIPPVVPE